MYPYNAIRRLLDSGTPSLLAMSSHIIIVPAQKVLLGVLNGHGQGARGSGCLREVLRVVRWQEGWRGLG